MACDETTHLTLILEELETRISVLEDTGVIRNLKARYAWYCHDNYNPDKIADLFVEDTVWESGIVREHQNAYAAFALRTERNTVAHPIL